MEDEIIPFQVAKGMVICGSFRGETDETHYVWIRRFDSEAQREALYKAVYETDHWKTKKLPPRPGMPGSREERDHPDCPDAEIDGAVAGATPAISGRHVDLAGLRRRGGRSARQGHVFPAPSPPR